MHPLCLLPVLSLLFGARASNVDSRNAVPHPLDVRDTVDVCATLDTGLVVPNFLGKMTSVGYISVCLCLSGCSDFLVTDEVAILAVTIAGKQAVSDTLVELVINAASSSKCVYPDHSIPTCIDDDPCGFHCTDGFTPQPQYYPTKCVCNPPSVVCNGKCVAPGACPTLKPRDNKKRWVGSGSCAENGPGWAACGVFGGGARAWECVNIARDLESCGGCVLPLTTYSPIGDDCTAITGVADVSCLSGKCVVHRCLQDFVPSLDGTRCIPNYPEISEPDIDGAEDDIGIEFVPTRIFGLEHVPLERN